MSCPDELTLSMYADRELPPEETDRVVAHLDSCSSCHALASALEQESVLLKEVLQGEPAASLGWAEASPSEARAHRAPSRSTSASAWIAGAIAAAALAPFMLEWVWQATPSFPTGLRWLGNLGGIGGFYSISGGLASLLSGGQDMLVSSFGFAATSFVGIAAIAVLARRRPALTGAVAAVALSLTAALGSPSPASAAEFRMEEEGTVKVEAGESIDDTVFLGDKTAIVAGTVDGDVFAAAERVEVTGTVRGSLFSAGESVTINGEVGGNVHAAGKNVELDTKVAGNGFLAGQNVVLTEASELSRDGFVAGETVRAKGKVGRGLYIGAENMELSGSVEREVRGYARQVSVTSTSSVGGDLHLTVPDEDGVEIDDGASIAGATEIEIEEEHEHRAFLYPGFYFGVLAKTVALLLIGLILVTLFPSLRPNAPESSNEVLRDMGIGFIALLATPVAILLIAFTIVGIPVSIVLAMIYAVLVFLSMLVVSDFAAARLPVLRGTNELVRVGLTLLAVLFIVEIPFVGAGLGFLIRIFGLGVLVLHLRHLYLKRQGPSNGAPAAEPGVLAAG